MPSPSSPQPSHRYRAFGMEIASDLPCPEFLPGTGAAEVTIRLRDTPTRLAARWSTGAFMEVDGTRILFDVPEVARFLVEDGCAISLTPAPGADPDLVRIYLLGSVFGALLQQRGCLTLHGSALQSSRGAFLVTGESGVGKSTLAAFLANQGLSVLSDDVCAITFLDTGFPMLHPAYPRLHLRSDVLEAVAADPLHLSASRKAVEKHGLDVRANFTTTPQPLCTVFWLEVSEDDTLGVEPMDGLASLTALAQNTYRPWYLEPMGRLGEHFRQTAAVANAATVYRIRRPCGLDNLPALADLIHRLVESPESGGTHDCI